MSAVVALELRAPVDGVVETDGVTPDRFAALGEREIAALPVWAGTRQGALGDFFKVRGERSARVCHPGFGRERERPRRRHGRQAN